ncbi:RNA polymerase sigma factor [Tunicatimonas pelagia]|uniref:RNA polymerase sigma factor n=1 Tax=Tunicatimonas pelagia TaxID=931531 RepID=UPI0026655C87|nr:RNA polymerase sigma factor [Tunicatimonas pelagia]WKN44957.1 RNA polymerase sigma factor [Tunicatimonas pelagia]
MHTISSQITSDKFTENLNKELITASIRCAEDASALWEAFRAGDQHSFTLLYYSHIDRLYHYGERLTDDIALIEDCLQDLFAELWTRQAQLPEVNAVKFYLFKALKRKIIKKLVQQQSLSSDDGLAEGYNFEITLSSEFDLIDLHVSQQQRQQLLQAINQLTHRQKEAITLYFYDGFSYQEIGEIMAMETRSVYNLVYRALASLRGFLTALLEPSV